MVTSEFYGVNDSALANPPANRVMWHRQDATGLMDSGRDDTINRKWPNPRRGKVKSEQPRFTDQGSDIQDRGPGTVLNRLRFRNSSANK